MEHLGISSSITCSEQIIYGIYNLYSQLICFWYSNNHKICNDTKNDTATSTELPETKMTLKKERFIGLAVAVLGLLTLFVLIPIGIDSPDYVEVLALAPEFWPIIVGCLFTLSGIFMAIRPFEEKDDDEEGAPEPVPWLERLPKLAMILGCLFIFYFVAPYLGFVLPAVVLTFLLAWFAEERRWHTLILVSIIPPVLLYVFFVFIANIPIPLGHFEFIRG